MEYSFFINFYIHHNIHCKYIQFLFGSPEMLLFIDFPATCDHRLLIKTSWRLAGPVLEISKTSKPRRPGFALGKRIYKLYIYIFATTILYMKHIGSQPNGYPVHMYLQSWKVEPEARPIPTPARAPDESGNQPAWIPRK